MGSIDYLEHGGGGFAVRRDGELTFPVDPREKHFQWVLMALQAGRIPIDLDDIPHWQHDVIFQRWCMAWDLPDFEAARRLTYLVDKYAMEISHDLRVHVGVELGQLWRDRRWRTLLNHIDRLPGHSSFSAAVSMDEEHAKMVAEAVANRPKSDEQDERGPALTTWTPEVAMLTNILDAVRSLQHSLIAVNSGKGKSPEHPKPSPRPRTALENALKHAEYHRQKKAHEALVARVLPNRR